MSIAALRQQLADIVQAARPDLPALATGIGPLDDALPNRGLPRGKLTEIAGSPGSGLTTVARHLVAAALDAGWWVAYVDSARTLAPRDWAALGAHDGLWVVRPPDPSRAAWCADVLLRSGAFGLVILDNAPALSRPVAVRLVRLARASDAAFVLLNADGQRSGIAGALQLRVQRAPKKKPPTTLDLTTRLSKASPPSATATTSTTRNIRISIEKGATLQHVEIPHAVPRSASHASHHAHCVREDPPLPDRRGVARRSNGRVVERRTSRAADGRRAVIRHAEQRDERSTTNALKQSHQPTINALG